MSRFKLEASTSMHFDASADVTVDEITLPGKNGEELRYNEAHISIRQPGMEVTWNIKNSDVDEYLDRWNKLAIRSWTTYAYTSQHLNSVFIPGTVYEKVASELANHLAYMELRSMSNSKENS